MTSIHDAAPEASIGIIVRAGWRRAYIDAAFTDLMGIPVRRWELAIDDPATVALIQSTVAALPRGASIADARVAVLDSLDPADVDARELVTDAFETLEQANATTARAAVRSIKTTDPNQTVGREFTYLMPIPARGSNLTGCSWSVLKRDICRESGIVMELP